MPAGAPIAVGAAAGAGAAPVPTMGFGMDDPSLAEKIRENSLNQVGGDREAMTYRVMADEGAAGSPASPGNGATAPSSPIADLDAIEDSSATMALDAAAVQEALSAAVPASDFDGLGLHAEAEEAAKELGDVPAVAPPAAKRRTRKERQSRPLLEAFVALVAAAAGVAVGYYVVFPLPFPVELPFEVPVGLDDVTVVRAATGGVVGLLVGWLCLRQVRPKR